MLKCPCKNCENRKLHCHAHCKKYEAYKAERIEIKKDLKNAADIAKYANRYSG